MRRFISNIFKETKFDLLANVIYDISKFLIGLILTYSLLYLIPKEGEIGEKLNESSSFTYLEIFVLIVMVSLVTLIFSNFFNKKKLEEIRERYYTDELTGLFNHRALAIKIEEAQNWAKKEKKPHS